MAYREEKIGISQFLYPTFYTETSLKTYKIWAIRVLAQERKTTKETHLLQDINECCINSTAPMHI